MEEINHRLMKIRPPSFVPNAPRQIHTWKLWKAHEYLAFLIYYSLPVFNGLKDADNYANLTKLVIC
jgi:hypothetical protein